MATACIGYRHRPTPLVTSASNFDMSVYAVVGVLSTLAGADRDAEVEMVLKLSFFAAIRLDSFNLCSGSPCPQTL